MQANSSITRGSGENGTSQYVTTVHQPQNRNTPDQSQDTFILNQTGKHGVMQGILGNSESFGLPVGDDMSPGVLNDVCNGYTEVEKIFDYWMMGLDHVSNDKTGDAGQEFSHEVQSNLVGQDPPPVKQETKILTHTSKPGLSTQAGYCVRNPQQECGSTEKENEKLEGSGLSGDPCVTRKRSLIGNAFPQGNDKYFKHDNLNLKDLPHSTPFENLRVFCTSNIEMESTELKCKPQNIKEEDAFRSEAEGLPEFDIWRESLIKGDCQHTSNEGVKPDCLDSKELFKATPVENHHRPQVKIGGQKFKFEPQDIKKEHGFWSEGMGLPQEQFGVCRDSLQKGDCQHASNEDVKPDCLDSKQLFKATPVENHHRTQVKMEVQKLKVEPQDFKKEEEFWSEGEGLPQFDVWRESLKIDDCQHTSNEGVKPDCLDSKELFKATPFENHHRPQVKMEGQKLKFEPQDFKKEGGFWSEFSSADSKELLESLPFGNFSTSQVKMESQELKCEPQNNCGQDVIWSKGVELSQNQFNASPQIKIENEKIKCEPQDMEEGEVMLSETFGQIKNERQDLNKAEKENIHKPGKVKLESCQMEIDHHFVRKQEKDVKPGSINLETSPGLKNDLQNTFHVKHEREVKAEYLGVKKEDPVWTVNSMKQEICTDGRSDCKVSVDPIFFFSHSLQTLSKIANTDNICNDKKSFPNNVPQCTKTVDFKAESYLKDEDPIWALHCTRREVKTEDTSHLKSPPPSNSQISNEFQRPSNRIASDPQQEAPVPVQQTVPSRFSHQVRTAQYPSVQTATQSSPMVNQKEVAQKRAAQQSFQYSQGGKSFSRHDTLEAPKINREQVKELSFCKLCGEKQILHLQKGEVLKERIVSKGSSSEKQLWKCCKCKRVFTMRGKFHFHQHAHLKKLSKPKIKCPECEREFDNLFTLKQHSEVHIKDPTIPCKLCDKVFRSEKKLKSHHIRCHTAKTLPCDKCEATFSNKASLYYHQAVHADRPFECSECKFKFRKKEQLKIHMQIHTDERPFPCLQCPSRFRIKAHLTAHMERHLRSGAQSRPHKKPASKRNRRKQELSETETSEELSATDVESTSSSDSDTSDTES